MNLSVSLLIYIQNEVALKTDQNEYKDKRQILAIKENVFRIQMRTAVFCCMRCH